MSYATKYEGMSSDWEKVFQGAVKSCPRDIALLVEEEKILVHKFVLAARSEYFNHLFSPEEDSQETVDQRGAESDFQDLVEISDVSQSNQSLVEISDVTDNVIEIRNTKVEAVRAVLVFIYKGHYNLDGEVETHLLALELARQFRLKDLEVVLINLLVTSINVENFFDFYNVKMRYQNVQLENSCTDFLKENGEDIAKSDNFSKLSRVSLLSLLDEENFSAVEINIFRAAERWAGVNKPNTKTVKEIVKRIRLATISQEDLFDIVSISEELPSIDIMEPIRSITKKDAASTNFRQHHQIIPVATTNVVLASRGATATGGFEDPMNCIDGKVNTGAVVRENFPLTITLGQAHWLSSLRVNIAAEGNSYTIESSPDGESWQAVVGETKGEEGTVWRTFEFSRRVVLHFRVTVKEIRGYGIGLFHFESPASAIAVTN